MKVLIVEDDPDTQILLYDILSTYPWEFEIQTTPLGADAIRWATESPPDLILLDVRLADEVDGYEVARSLREHPATRQTRIVMLSGLDDPVDQHAGKRAGADEYITKPVQSRILLATLQEMFDGA